MIDTDRPNRNRVVSTDCVEADSAIGKPEHERAPESNVVITGGRRNQCSKVPPVHLFHHNTVACDQGGCSARLGRIALPHIAGEPRRAARTSSLERLTSNVPWGWPRWWLSTCGIRPCNPRYRRRLIAAPSPFAESDADQAVAACDESLRRNNGFLGTAPDQRPLAFTRTAVWAVSADGKLLHNWVERSAWEAYQSLTGHVTRRITSLPRRAGFRPTGYRAPAHPNLTATEHRTPIAVVSRE